MARARPLPVDVCFLPSALRPEQLSGRAVVVFDVLRATTSMAAALNAGVANICIFPSTADVIAAGKKSSSALLCGEEKCLRPPGFDLGNSPGAFHERAHRDRTLFMSTTNGTIAILAARGAPTIFVGALVNAAAVAARLREAGLPVTLLCAGTNGQIAMEDVLGAGAVMDSLTMLASVEPLSDAAYLAREFFAAGRNKLPTLLRDARGGQNLIAARLEEDIDFAARLNIFDVVGRVSSDTPPIVTACDK